MLITAVLLRQNSLADATWQLEEQKDTAPFSSPAPDPVCSSALVTQVYGKLSA